LWRHRRAGRRRAQRHPAAAPGTFHEGAAHGQRHKPGVAQHRARSSFDTQAQFARAFRARFGVTPAQFYDMVRRKDEAALAAQAERVGFTNLQAWIEHVAGPESA